MMVLVVGVSNAYVIFQNMASNNPVVATKSYGLAADEKSSMSLICYFHDNINSAYSDDFDGPDIDATKWNLTEDTQLASRILLPYCTDPIGFQTTLPDYHGYPEFLKIADGKVYLDKYNKIRARAILDNRVWRSGDIDVETKFSMVAKSFKRPWCEWIYYAGSYQGSGYGFFYPYGSTGRQEQLASPDEDFTNIYYRFTRVGNIWSGYAKLNAGDAWTLLTSGVGSTKNVKMAFVFRQTCFNDDFSSENVGLNFEVMDIDQYNKVSYYGCPMHFYHAGFPYYYKPNTSFIGEAGGDHVYEYPVGGSVYQSVVNPDYY